MKIEHPPHAEISRESPSSNPCPDPAFRRHHGRGRNEAGAQIQRADQRRHQTRQIGNRDFAGKGLARSGRSAADAALYRRGIERGLQSKIGGSHGRISGELGIAEETRGRGIAAGDNAAIGLDGGVRLGAAELGGERGTAVDLETASMLVTGGDPEERAGRRA